MIKDKKTIEKEKIKKLKIHCPYCKGSGFRYFGDDELKILFKDKSDSSEKKEKMIALRKKGFTYKKIASLFDISRQRAYQIIKRNNL